MNNPWLVTIIGGAAVVLLTWTASWFCGCVRLMLRAITNKLHRTKEPIQYHLNFGEGKDYQFVVDTVVDKKTRTCESCIYSTFYDSFTLECRRHAPTTPLRDDQTQVSLVGREDFCGDYEPKTLIEALNEKR